MLKDMLRASVLDQPGSWDRYMPLVEFAYNNSFHASIGMAPYEALYGRKCQSLLCWILTAQSRQKSYADQRRKSLEFEVGEHVFLRVTPTVGIGRAINTKKLNPRYIGLFQILRRFGPVAYQVALPPHLSNLHDVFHVSQLYKYTADATHVLEHETVELRKNLTFQVRPVKVVWKRAGVKEHTWELESEMRKDYPDFSQMQIATHLGDLSGW
ncbi:uncharacterized protein LOC127747617 [Arachis duranensis]|uniref:Uncharacterized protein LOC127747617 n=1 Tax=Arachis duranensis TaxID=130453 RepID=A0A9C6TYP0_ARADU|nr:uncharacterized protein LOC127747617 [Arachis duranensis]